MPHSVQKQRSCSHRPRVLSRGRQFDPNRAPLGADHPGSDDLFDHLPVDVPDVAERLATKHHELDVKHVHEPDDPAAQQVRGPLDLPRRDLVSVPGRPRDGLEVEAVGILRETGGRSAGTVPAQRQRDRLDHRARRAIRLEATAAAAEALGPVRIEYQVTELTGVCGGAPIDVVLEEDACPHAHAHVDEGEVVNPARTPRPAFPDRGSRRVVVDDHGIAGLLSQRVGERHLVPPGKVRRIENDAAVVIEGAGARDTKT
jgi:hypothetical protein